jgi:hypothetical protein
MEDLTQRRAQLESDLRRSGNEFNKEYRSVAETWWMGIGPLKMTATIGTSEIGLIYICFNMICFAAGIAFTLASGALQALGIALVVGGLFSFGTFMAQWWDHSWQRNNATIDRAFDSNYADKRYSELQRLAKERLELERKLEELSGPSGIHGKEPSKKNEK